MTGLLEAIPRCKGKLHLTCQSALIHGKLWNVPKEGRPSYPCLLLPQCHTSEEEVGLLLQQAKKKLLYDKEKCMGQVYAGPAACETQVEASINFQSQGHDYNQW